MPGESAFLSSVYAPFCAMLPITWLIVSLGVFKMQAYKACFLGLLGTMAIAFAGWDMPLPLLAGAALDGAVFAFLPILWVILAAFFTYNIAIETKAIDHIKQLLSSISPDRRIQALLIAWGLGSFMEGVAGFGTAVAVPAALLIALGFEPFLAAILCLLANTIAVAFGVVGVPVTTLAQVTDLPLPLLSEAIIVQLTPFVFCVPALIVYCITRSLSGLAEVWLPTLAAGGGFAVAQYFTARYIGPELPAIIGSLAALGATVVAVKIAPPKTIWTFADDSPEPARAEVPAINVKSQLMAWSPYILLLVIVLCTSRLFPPVHSALSSVRGAWLIYTGPGAKPFSIAWILTPGTLVMISAVLGGLIQGAGPARLFAIAGATARQLGKTAVTIVCIVAMAKVLGYSGMVTSISVALAASTGSFYALVSPLLGMLGTFITGSDTSSNILFGQLQKEVAIKIGGDPVWMAAANTSGACIGKLISPQSMAIAGIATGLTGREGDLLVAAMRYAGVFIVALSLLVFFAA